MTGGGKLSEKSTRRNFLRCAGAAAGGALLTPSKLSLALATEGARVVAVPAQQADYTLTIAVKPIELAPDRIVSVTTYNGQFPGPLLRFKEGQPVTVDIHNETDTAEQLHWHGQAIPADVDGAAEEGTPFIPAHGSRRITFTPKPSGFRFYHTRSRGRRSGGGTIQRAGGSGVYRAEKQPGRLRPRSLSHDEGVRADAQPGRRYAMDFLSPAAEVAALKEKGETAMKASLAKGNPHGYEVGYRSFTINGKMLRHGEPVRVKQGERVLFHVLNGSATEIRSLYLPGHSFTIVATDGNPLPQPVRVPGLWLGTAERISAVVEMNHPGVWVMGDLADDDRHNGMGIVVEYAGYRGKAQWIPPKPFKWNYAHLGASADPATQPDETFEMLFEKKNAAADGFNLWTINGVAYPDSQMMAAPSFHLHEGRRYRLRMENASDDIHPVHLHRRIFELRRIAGQPTSGVMKDVMMLGGYQEAEVDFVADNPE